MKRMILLCAVAAAAMDAPASAAKIFNLSGVTLQYGGTLTGSFTTNDALTQLTAVNIVASAGANGSFIYNSFTYNDISKADWVSLPTQGFELTYGSGADQLRLNLFNFTSAGAGIYAGSSYEYQSQAGSRSVTGGSVVAAAVPEPTSWALMIGGLGLVGMAMRRRVTAISFA